MAQEPKRRLNRAERRAQILDAAARAFNRGGFAAVGLDDVAAEAGVSRVILYRHFSSKSELYQAVLDSVCEKLERAAGAGDWAESSIAALLRVAAADPDAFRLLYRHAARESEFQARAENMSAKTVAQLRERFADQVSDPAWRDWAARLVGPVAVEAVLAWLDAGAPEPERAAERIQTLVDAVLDAARS